MENEQIKRIAKRIYENSGGAVRNYVMLEGLIRRFLQLNPDADPEAIDWTAVWDDELTYEEILEEFKRHYPMYRWEDKTIDEKTLQMQGENRIKDVAFEVINQIDIEDFDKLIQELQKLRDEVLEDVRRIEAETSKPKPEAVEVKTPRPETPPPAVEAEPPTVKPTLALMAKFPFLSSSLPLMKAYKLDKIPQEVRDRAVGRVLEALERGERGVIPKLDNPWVELLSFPYARALVNYVGDDWLRRRWALAEAARAERLLHGEGNDMLMTIVKELGINVAPQNGKWDIHFTDYLKLAGRLATEPRFKLVNRILDRGMVSLTRPELIRLVREKLYSLFAEEKKPTASWSPEEAGIIREALNRRASRIIAPAPSREWAPCMVSLRNRVADASHFGLFALAAYMAQKNYDINSIVDVLRVRSDFDERIARYQVEHIAGLRGSRVKYKPPSCQAMKGHGLCIDDGKQCPHSIKNPLQYRQPTDSAGPR